MNYCIESQSFESYSKEISLIPSITHEEEISLFKKYNEYNDLDAAYKIVTSHLKFVVFCAKKLAGYGLPLEDLVQEGNIGLMKSVKKFDHTQYSNIRFVSYAVHYINQHMYDYILKNWKIVKAVTSKAHRKLFFNMKKYNKIGSFSDTEISKISKELNVSVDQVKYMEPYIATHDLYIDQLNDDEDNEYSFDIPDINSDPLDFHIENEKLIDVDSMLDVLNDREKHIIRSRYLDDTKLGLVELGKIYNISAERVRQLENQALKRLKNSITTD